MIERAVEAERKSQHMARAFEERVDEMVEARAAEMTVEEASEINSKPTDSEDKDYNDEEVEEAIESATEEVAAEETSEETPAETEAEAEEAPAEETPPAPAPTWGDDEDPWADDQVMTWAALLGAATPRC